MKLSEAIRLGAMLKPQAFGETWSADLSKSCAMAAAIEAAKVPMWTGDPGAGAPQLRATQAGHIAVTVAPPEEWWQVLRPFYSCPECCALHNGVETVSHLNDDHRWTREAIADWVEGIERAQDAPVAPVETVAAV